MLPVIRALLLALPLSLALGAVLLLLVYWRWLAPPRGPESALPDTGMVRKEPAMVIHGVQGRRTSPALSGVSAGAWRGLLWTVPLSLALWGVLILLVCWLLGG
jgi:hypothetical protein